MTTGKRELDDLEVLERVMGYSGSPTLRGKRPQPAQYMGLLRFSVEETPRYAAALQRLIDRRILVIVRAQNTWVLAMVSGRAAAERDRLRAQTTDPVVYLKELVAGLRRVQAGIQGGVEDPGTMIEQGTALLGQAITVAESIERKASGGGKR